MKEVRSHLRDSTALSKQSVTYLRDHRLSTADCKLEGDQVLYRDRLWIPRDDELILVVIASHHQSPAGGHPGRAKTFELIQRHYFWPEMHQDILKYVDACHTCKRTKAFRDAYTGGLQQLRAPDRPWEDLAVDHVVELPPSKLDGQEFTNILVVTDRMTKMRHFIPCDSVDAATTAKLFLRHVYRQHGLPKTITSDRGSAFISAF